jgi:hypothetical protein
MIFLLSPLILQSIVATKARRRRAKRKVKRRAKTKVKRKVRRAAAPAVVVCILHAYEWIRSSKSSVLLSSLRKAQRFLTYAFTPQIYVVPTASKKCVG